MMRFSSLRPIIFLYSAKNLQFHARGGNFIREDIAGFDAAFFSLNPEEVKAMDPQQRWLLEAAYHSFEAAGLSMEDVRGTNTATYVGSFIRDYESTSSFFLTLVVFARLEYSWNKVSLDTTYFLLVSIQRLCTDRKTVMLSKDTELPARYRISGTSVA